MLILVSRFRRQKFWRLSDEIVYVTAAVKKNNSVLSLEINDNVLNTTHYAVLFWNEQLTDSPFPNM